MEQAIFLMTEVLQGTCYLLFSDDNTFFEFENVRSEHILELFKQHGVERVVHTTGTPNPRPDPTKPHGGGGEWSDYGGCPQLYDGEYTVAQWIAWYKAASEEE